MNEQQAAYHVDHWRERAMRAEARAETLERERDAAQEGWDVFAARYQGAEARAERAEQALRELYEFAPEHLDRALRGHSMDHARWWKVLAAAREVLGVVEPPAPCDCGAPRCERDGCQDKPTPIEAAP